MVGNQVRSARIPRPQPSSTTLLPVYGSAPTTPTTNGKADISEICQHMTQLEEAGCSLARVTTCRAHTGKQAHFNYFSFTTPRFPCRAPAKARLVRTGEPRWREPKCVGGEPDTRLCSHRRRTKAGTASPAAARHGRAARWPGPRHCAERTGLAEGRPPLSGLPHPPGRRLLLWSEVRDLLHVLD